MLSVTEAQAKVVEGLKPLGSEAVSLGGALGRVLSADIAANRTQPPADVSAMDGYAVRAQDVATLPATLKQIGSVAAGATFSGSVGKGEAVRIFTGAPVPKGANTIVIQENVKAEGDVVRVVDGAAPAGRHIRRAGLDFKKGDKLFKAGHRLSARDLALIAAMNHPTAPCTRPPRVCILATGDELMPPGSELGPAQIVGSSSFGLSASVLEWGGTVRDIGIARDTIDDIRMKAEVSDGCDVFVTLGGASVGEHDLIQKALTPDLKVGFWKIAMRPGKPLIFGRYKSIPFLGLPGNPVSAMVCALLFLKPMILRLLGASEPAWRITQARAAVALPANEQRQDYVRCHLVRQADGSDVAEPFPVQDSSMMRTYAFADALIVRPPGDPAKAPGDLVSVLHLG
jgi:molybdopterin molybdotransferase